MKENLQETSKPIPATTGVGAGLRLNQGKTRYDLNPIFATEQMAKVMTLGSLKYAPRNWERGMSWTSVIASLKRHLAAIERGEDYDPESGLLHSAHVMTNAAFLTEYYKIFPQGDDRPINLMAEKRVGVDIDDVLADFIGGVMEIKPEMENRSVFWNDPMIDVDFLKDNKDFWMGLKPLAKLEDFHFEPVCYITSRPVPTEWTVEWLNKHGYPKAPVITTYDKVAAAKEYKLDVFIDDSLKNYLKLNKAGILCYLMDSTHNRRYNVGHKRIKSLNELV